MKIVFDDGQVVKGAPFTEETLSSPLSYTEYKENSMALPPLEQMLMGLSLDEEKPELLPQAVQNIFDRRKSPLESARAYIDFVVKYERLGRPQLVQVIREEADKCLARYNSIEMAQFMSVKADVIAKGAPPQGYLKAIGEKLGKLSKDFLEAADARDEQKIHTLHERFDSLNFFYSVLRLFWEHPALNEECLPLVDIFVTHADSITKAATALVDWMNKENDKGHFIVTESTVKSLFAIFDSSRLPQSSLFCSVIFYDNEEKWREAGNEEIAKRWHDIAKALESHGKKHQLDSQAVIQLYNDLDTLRADCTRAKSNIPQLLAVQILIAAQGDANKVAVALDTHLWKFLASDKMAEAAEFQEVVNRIVALQSVTFRVQFEIAKMRVMAGKWQQDLPPMTDFLNMLADRLLPYARRPPVTFAPIDRIINEGEKFLRLIVSIRIISNTVQTSVPMEISERGIRLDLVPAQNLEELQNQIDETLFHLFSSWSFYKSQAKKSEVVKLEESVNGVLRAYGKASILLGLLAESPTTGPFMGDGILMSTWYKKWLNLQTEKGVEFRHLRTLFDRSGQRVAFWVVSGDDNTQWVLGACYRDREWKRVAIASNRGKIETAPVVMLGKDDRIEVLWLQSNSVYRATINGDVVTKGRKLSVDGTKCSDLLLSHNEGGQTIAKWKQTRDIKVEEKIEVLDLLPE